MILPSGDLPGATVADRWVTVRLYAAGRDGILYPVTDLAGPPERSLIWSGLCREFCPDLQDPQWWPKVLAEMSPAARNVARWCFTPRPVVAALDVALLGQSCRAWMKATAHDIWPRGLLVEHAAQAMVKIPGGWWFAAAYADASPEFCTPPWPEGYSVRDGSMHEVLRLEAL